MVNLSSREINPELLEACRRGDREAFRTLYDQYKDKVYSMVLCYFHGDASAASDTAQQVFLKVFTSIAQFRGEAEFSTWLYRIVVNACTDAIRHHKGKAIWSDREFIESIAAPGCQEMDYQREQTAVTVRIAVAALPPKFRIAVLLRHFEDLTYEQIAQALHCSMGTVASRLSRGHKMLAERLKGLQG